MIRNVATGALHVVPSGGIALGFNGHRDYRVAQLGGVSSKHCVLLVRDDVLTVKSLIHYGTYVNGYVLQDQGQEYCLSTGDTLSLINPNGKHAEQYSWTVCTTTSRVGDYSILPHRLGFGGFGTVYRGKHLHSHREVAIKVMAKPFVIPGEGGIMKMFNHKHIVRILEEVETEDSLFLIQELVPDGNLMEYFCKRGPFEEVEAKYLFVQLVDAVSHMHSKSVVHRDLKPENVLVEVVDSFSSTADNASPFPGQKVVLKVTDFGVSGRFCAGVKMGTNCGTGIYKAPEIETGEGYGPNVDAWSLGIMLVRLLSDLKVQVSDVADLNVSDDCRELLTALLETDPLNRIGLDGICAHKWLKECINGDVPVGKLANGSKRSRDEEQAEDTTTQVSPTKRPSPHPHPLKGGPSSLLMSAVSSTPLLAV